MVAGIKQALDAFSSGRFVIVYDADGREEECDFFLPAEHCTMEHVRTMRKEGGGLIFLMVRPDIRDRLGLPFLQEMYPALSRDHPVFRALIADDIPYDTKSSFSLTINHRKTFTGITDTDRALTVKEFGLLAKKLNDLSEAQALAELGEHFRAPGHVPICLGSDRILETRFGHTELSCALSTMAGLSGASVGCEIMGDDGKAMPRSAVKEYAERMGIPFLDGDHIIKAWRSWDGEWKRSYRPPERKHREVRHGTPSPHYAAPDLPRKKGTRVMATGVFDILHPGHLHFLNSARALGDELVVVVARDSTVESQKRHPVVSERIRREMILALKMVDGAYLGYEGDQYRIVQELRPDIIALGYDQPWDPLKLEEELRKRGMEVKVVRLDKRTGDIEGTRQILERIKRRP